MHTREKPEHAAIRPLLRRLGLDEREVEIYLALLPMRVARASTIARAAKQSRSNTYLVLRSLEEKGLVSEVERGKVLHFVVEAPQRLMTYLLNREEELHGLKPLVEGALPALQSLTSPLIGQPRVTMLHGMDGMKQMYRELLPNEFVALFNPQAMYDAFQTNLVQLLFGKHMRLRGRDLLVNNASARRYAAEVAQDEHYEIRLLPKGIHFETDTIVAGDTIAFFSYDDERTIIRIENQNLADAFRAWFDVLWNTGRKVR
jgi:sugar-specific transcriptional regulator TrmB